MSKLTVLATAKTSICCINSTERWHIEILVKRNTRHNANPTVRCTVESSAYNLDGSFAQEGFDKARRVTVAFSSMAKSSKFTLEHNG